MKRDDILDAAAQVIRQKGFHGASMANIAEAAKLQKASLYHHISGKQEILLALLDRALKMSFEQVDVIAKKTLPADVKLRQMMQVYLRLLAEESDLSAVLLFEHRSLEPEQHARHIPNRDRFEALWREVVEDGVRTGLFACSDVALAVRALMGTLNWTLTWYRPDGLLTMEQIADQYANLLLNGLMK